MNSEVHTGLWQGDLKETDHWEDIGTNGRITLKWIFKKQNGVGDVEWIDQAQDRAKLWALVNTVMNLWVL